MMPELELRPVAHAPISLFRAALARPRDLVAGPRPLARRAMGTTAPWLVLTGAVAPASQWWRRPPMPDETLAAPGFATRSVDPGAPFAQRAWGALLFILGYQ